jgi:hypothetical protein
MLPLTRQVQIASDIAKNSVARLAGQEPPRFEDTETTIEQLRARIARTIDVLKSIPASALWNSRDWISCSAGRSPTCFFTSPPHTTSCATTAWISASETSSTPVAIGRHMTNGGARERLLLVEREGNHGAAGRALPL